MLIGVYVRPLPACQFTKVCDKEKGRVLNPVCTAKQNVLPIVKFPNKLRSPNLTIRSVLLSSSATGSAQQQV